MKMLIKLMLVIAVLSKKHRKNQLRKHRNFYDVISTKEVKKIAKFEPFFMLLVG